MTPESQNNFLRRGVLLMPLLALAGCQDTGPKNSNFFVHDETESVNTAYDRQIANGARLDGMLRERHFDGPRLNSLGRTKLDRMFAAAPAPVTIYLPDASTKQDRHDAIVAYAKDHGLAESDLNIVDGLNPASTHLAGPQIERLSKTELGNTGNGQGAPGATDSPAAPATGLSGNNSPSLSGLTGKQGG